ncbi:hypothetical protein GA0115235_103427 [Streptomyces sp. DpondAA-F4a]|nr:hypothetical protein GA0115235_103427 [Streptomyces sp. DpondAA-F4a]
MAVAIVRHSSRVTSRGSRSSSAQSACCPAHSSMTQAESRAEARADPGCGSSASSRWASASTASPVTTASGTPNTAHAVGRCRRVASSSMTSSWSRVKLWTSSTATAARRADSGSPPSARAAASTSAGLMALPACPDAGVPSAFCQPKWYRATRRIAPGSVSTAALRCGSTRPRVRSRSTAASCPSVAASVLVMVTVTPSGRLEGTLVAACAYGPGRVRRPGSAARAAAVRPGAYVTASGSPRRSPGHRGRPARGSRRSSRPSPGRR